MRVPVSTLPTRHAFERAGRPSRILGDQVSQTLSREVPHAEEEDTSDEGSEPQGRSPTRRETLHRPQVARRRRSATVAVKKDTTMLQTDAGTKVVWGANQKRPSKT